MSSDDLKFTEAVLRCICSVFRHPSAPVDLIFSDSQLLAHLLGLTMQSITNEICITTIFSCACKVSMIKFYYFLSISLKKKEKEKFKTF